MAEHSAGLQREGGRVRSRGTSCRSFSTPSAAAFLSARVHASAGAATDRERAINELATDLPRFWDYGTLDAPIVYAALDALRTRQPRVLYIMLGEGDEWAHEGQVRSLSRRQLSRRSVHPACVEHRAVTPRVCDKTTLLVTTDHGRGATTKDWSDHGQDVPAAENTWFAALGPSVPALGVRRDVTVTTSQLAATIAAVLGLDFMSASPKAAMPLPLVRQ